MIPRFCFISRTGIRIISHLHLSNKQVFKHSLKIPGDTSEPESKKENHQISLLRRYKRTYPSFKEKSPFTLFDVHIKLLQYYFQIAT